MVRTLKKDKIMIRLKDRPIHEHSQAPQVVLEKDTKFERTLTVVNPRTHEVIGFLTVEQAKAVVQWVEALEELL